MQEQRAEKVGNWVFLVLESARSGKSRLYLSGVWPDGKVKTSSAITSVMTDEGLVQTTSGSTYLLEGTSRFGQTLAEGLSDCGEWTPAGQ